MIEWVFAFVYRVELENLWFKNTVIDVRVVLRLRIKLNMFKNFTTRKEAVKAILRNFSNYLVVPFTGVPSLSRVYPLRTRPVTLHLTPFFTSHLSPSGVPASER